MIRNESIDILRQCRKAEAIVRDKLSKARKEEDSKNARRFCNEAEFTTNALDIFLSLREFYPGTQESKYWVYNDLRTTIDLRRARLGKKFTYLEGAVTK